MYYFLKVKFFLSIVFFIPIIKAYSTDLGTVTSPDGKIELRLYQIQNGNSLRLFYNVTFQGYQVIEKSELDIMLDNHISELAMAIRPDSDYHFVSDMEFRTKNDTSVNTTWLNSFGEKSIVSDNYNQSSFLFEKKNKKGYRLQIDIRVYNEGIAFRYHFPLNPKGLYYRVVKENTEFVLPAGTKAWYHQWAQAPYELLPLENWKDESERPLTCQLPNGLYVALAEAQMIDYVRTKFKIKENTPGTLVTSLWSEVDAITPYSTPWRVVMIAETPGKLLENNYIILNLNDSCQIKDTSWIKPGKIMREITQTNENSKACIDFAAENGLQYILYDWKWYGPAFDFNSDASTVSIDLDLQKWIDYGKEKGVGIWVYVNQQALLTQMRKIFPVYKKWGIKGVKFGFVQVGSHRWTSWLHEAVKLAAENQLMVNIHDEFRTTGENRTYPNILTVEGIRGNEEFPDATHNNILPYTRMIAGTADYTVCYFDKRLKTTHAHQLALPVIFFSPLQTLFWYDKPSYYQGEKEIEFFKKVPVTWDETTVIKGKPGEYTVIARRKGAEWFVGIITNTEARTLELSFDFLKQNQKYNARFYSDDPKLETRTKVKIEDKKIKSTDKTEIRLLPSGGMAIWLRPL